MVKETKTSGKIKRLVVKFGTDALTNKISNSGDSIDQRVFNDIARQIIWVQGQVTEVVIISSGGIKCGRERLKQLGIEDTLIDKREIAAVGARHLLNHWGIAFEPYGSEIGQIWVTYANLRTTAERKSIKKGIKTLIANQIVPIININDVVSGREIIAMDKTLAENDKLTRVISQLIKADGVLFMSEVGGIYSADPRRHHNPRLYQQIGIRDAPRILRAFSGTSSNGTGGAKPKLKEALACYRSGKRVAIAGLEKDFLIRFVSGESIGTTIGNETILSD